MKRLVFVMALAFPTAAHAETRCASIEMTPSEKLQIVAWIETASGEYVDTTYITQTVGRFGLGNRPGRWDFNSGPMWPYGRRLATFPVWAHRHGHTFPSVVFQNCCGHMAGSTGGSVPVTDDPNYCFSVINDSTKSSPNDREFADCGENNLSHAFDESSRELHYCQPFMASDPKWAKADAMTCATVAHTDKGKFSTTSTSLYPPRLDLIYNPQTDAPSVEQFKTMAPFDAVSQATPPGGVAQAIAWPVPDALPAGSYVMFVEVAKEFDHNATFSEAAHPAPPAVGPMGIQWSSFGLPYLGQPSVVYKVPFEITTGQTTASTSDFIGYSAIDGSDGNIRPPDGSITTDTPGSGASRLQLVSDGSAMYRVRVSVSPNDSSHVPSAPANIKAAELGTQTITLAFTAPGDGTSTVAGYDVRIKANGVITPETFDDAMKVGVAATLVRPGQTQTLELMGLLPETDYSVAIRAFDACRNNGDIAIVNVRTADRIAGEVDACFIATAAYGSVMANDVELLRHFRDSLLESTVLGELAVEAYYTFGPPVAGMIGESDLLRTMVRAMLAPIVDAVRKLSV
ncbi:MAG TPA: CFI-box-CTERM domain-containing protein [Kofleriaceae bacterium]|nr:CFI-box-CTERM domain-containing protein [Kofleriaceae bacterium]